MTFSPIVLWPWNGFSDSGTFTFANNIFKKEQKNLWLINPIPKRNDKPFWSVNTFGLEYKFCLLSFISNFFWGFRCELKCLDRICDWKEKLGSRLLIEVAVPHWWVTTPRGSGWTGLIWGRGRDPKFGKYQSRPLFDFLFAPTSGNSKGGGMGWRPQFGKHSTGPCLSFCVILPLLQVIRWGLGSWPPVWEIQRRAFVRVSVCVDPNGGNWMGGFGVVTPKFGKYENTKPALVWGGSVLIFVVVFLLLFFFGVGRRRRGGSVALFVVGLFGRAPGAARAAAGGAAAFAPPPPPRPRRRRPRPPARALLVHRLLQRVRGLGLGRRPSAPPHPLTHTTTTTTSTTTTPTTLPSFHRRFPDPNFCCLILHTFPSKARIMERRSMFVCVCVLFFLWGLSKTKKCV